MTDRTWIVDTVQKAIVNGSSEDLENLLAALGAHLLKIRNQRKYLSGFEWTFPNGETVQIVFGVRRAEDAQEKEAMPV